MQVNTKQLRKALISTFKAKLTPYIHGSPGIGKSALVRSLANEFNLKLIDIRLSQCDPTELNSAV